MGLFARRRQGIPPPNIVEMMERLGRHEIDLAASTDDPMAIWTHTQAPLVGAATGQPAEFVKALADACVPVGGFAVYGAEKAVVNLIGNHLQSDDWWRILDASLEFLRTNLVPPMRVAGYAWQRFIAAGGTANTWIPLRQPPSREEARLRPIEEGEARRVLVLGGQPDANVLLVTRRGDDYVGIIDAPWSSDDPTRVQNEWKHFSDQYDLYLEASWNFQLWHGADPDIEPFMVTPKPLI
jgi:hypothetical protein